MKGADAIPINMGVPAEVSSSERFSSSTCKGYRLNPSHSFKCVYMYMRYVFLFLLTIWAGAAVSVETLTLTEDGIRQLSLEKGFNLEKITTALPGYAVTKSSDGYEILIHSGDELVITLHRLEKGLFNIEIHSNKVINSLGHKIGDSFKTIYGTSTPHCAREEEGLMLVCVAPGSAKIVYLFVTDAGDGGGQHLASIFWSYEWWEFRDK